MHVITQKRIWEAQFKYPQCATALDAWYRLMHKTRFSNYAELKNIYGSVDRVGDKFIFNIGGNKIRLIAIIHFNRQKIYILDILTHKEYDKKKWTVH